MDKIEIQKIGEREGLTGRQLNDFVKFIQLRFPNEGDKYYIGEWAERFESGTEWFKAVGETQKALMKVNPTYYKQFLNALKTEVKRFEKAQGFKDYSLAFTAKLPSYSKKRRFK